MKFITTFLFSLSTFFLFGQNDANKAPSKTIEVTGVAEMSIPPNEFVFKISLAERMEGKEKITIEKQEIALKEGLATIGIDVQKDLKVVDVTSIYSGQKRKKDEIGTKEYRLTIRDASKINKLQDLAYQLLLNRLDLIIITNTDLPKFRKETKIEAIKAAKEKAEYLLTAIGQKLGKAVFVQEISDNRYYGQEKDPILMSNSVIFENKNIIPSEEKELNLRSINIQFRIFVKFEIE